MEINPIEVLKTCDYIPIVSSATNLIILIAKGVFSLMRVQRNPGSFRAYAMDKSLFRCLVHISLFGVANIAFAIYDYQSKGDLLAFLGIGINTLPVLYTPNVNIVDYPLIDPQKMDYSIMKGQVRRNRNFLAFRIEFKIPQTRFKDLNPEFTQMFCFGDDGCYTETGVLILIKKSNSMSDHWIGAFHGFPGYIFSNPFQFGVFDPMHIEADKFAPLRALKLGRTIQDDQGFIYKLV